MDKKVKRSEEQVQEGCERAQDFIGSLGEAMQAPELLALSDDGVCGFRLSSGSSVVFLYYARRFSLLCQLNIEIKQDLDAFSCYQGILRHSFYINPDKDGIAHVPPEGDKLIINWQLPVNQSLPSAEVFAEYLSQADNYWNAFLREQRQS